MTVTELAIPKRERFFKDHEFKDHIGSLQRGNRLNSVRLLNQIPRGLRRIGRFQLPKPEITLRQAEFVSWRAAKVADVTADVSFGITKFEAKDQKEKARLWNQFYREAITAFTAMPAIKSDPALVGLLKTHLEKVNGNGSAREPVCASA